MALAHWGILHVTWLNLDWPRSVRNLKDQAIELVSPDSLTSQRKQVVQSSQIEPAKDQSGEARYAGAFQQRVPQEMQSPLKGAFEEGQLAEVPETPELSEEGDVNAAPPLKNLLKLGRSPHALSKDIPYGNQTLLNTDKVRYASFINRIADEIYSPWVDAAEKALKDFVVERRSIEPNLYITRLRITLDNAGSVQGIQVLQSCGISELDEAPKRAFWDAEPFPNPPGQLLDSDGFIRLTYEFQFEWKNSGFNIIPWKI